MSTQTTIRPDLVEAINRAFPHGVVELPPDADEGHFSKVYARLRNRLGRIKGAAILYERDWRGALANTAAAAGAFHPGFSEDDDFDADVDDTYPVDDQSTSYHLFFLGLTDPTKQATILGLS